MVAYEVAPVKLIIKYQSTCIFGFDTLQAQPDKIGGATAVARRSLRSSQRGCRGAARGAAQSAKGGAGGA